MLVQRTGSDYDETTCLPQDSTDPEARAAEVEQQQKIYEWAFDVSGHENYCDCLRTNLFVRYISFTPPPYTSNTLAVYVFACLSHEQRTHQGGGGVTLYSFPCSYG